MNLNSEQTCHKCKQLKICRFYEQLTSSMGKCVDMFNHEWGQGYPGRSIDIYRSVAAACKHFEKMN